MRKDEYDWAQLVYSFIQHATAALLVGQYESSCLQFPFSVIDDKLEEAKQKF